MCARLCVLLMQNGVFKAPTSLPGWERPPKQSVQNTEEEVKGEKSTADRPRVC